MLSYPPNATLPLYHEKSSQVALPVATNPEDLLEHISNSNLTRRFGLPLLRPLRRISTGISGATKNLGIWTFKPYGVITSQVALYSVLPGTSSTPHQTRGSSAENVEPSENPACAWVFDPLKPRHSEASMDLHRQRSIFFEHPPVVEHVIGNENIVFNKELNMLPYPSVTRNAKRPRTPFPPTSIINAQSTCVNGDARKRMRLNVTVSATHQEHNASISFEETPEDNKFLPFAKWLTSFVNGVIIIDASLMSTKEINIATGRILDILLAYYPLDCDRDFEGVLPTISFLATWTHFCTLPLHIINRMEITALQMLDYDVGITNSEWRAWLVALSPAISKCAMGKPGQMTAVYLLKDALKREKEHNLGRPSALIYREKHIHRDLLDTLRELLLEGTKTIQPHEFRVNHITPECGVSLSSQYYPSTPLQ
ncbi:hypothetical protein H0H81_007790 [Sphagnurus paluster]|uniref:Uncharacterized protein n=1 Tax=Sphagnurus paluster TaxID=117069 RepID=A0A9P7GQC7_9AGAR|nr:hypothetical protein H0H81_007790 [Sphagnurus paluster]